MILRCHHIHGRWLHLAIDADGLGIVAADVEDDALAILVAGCLGLVKACKAGSPLSQSTAIFVSQVGLHDWWKRCLKHVVSQIETGIRRLIITTGGAVESVMRVFLQGIHCMVCRNLGAVAHDTGRRIGILLHEDYLLSPVAEDVAPEGRTCTRTAAHGAHGAIIALILMTEEIVEMLAAINRGLGNKETGIISAAAILRKLLSAQVTIPPDTIADITSRGILQHLALRRPRIVAGIAPEFQTQMVGVDIEGGTSTHIIDRRQIPLLEMLTRGRIVEILSYQGRLLDGKGLHARTGRVDICNEEAVAMLDIGREDHVFP